MKILYFIGVNALFCMCASVYEFNLYCLCFCLFGQLVSVDIYYGLAVDQLSKTE